MKEQIKDLRIKIDGLSQLVKDLGLGHWVLNECWVVDIEKQNAYNSLILAKAWLGKVLGELGETTPYINDGKRKEVGDIEPAADKAVPALKMFLTDKGSWDELNHIEKVDWIRQEIDSILKEDFRRKGRTSIKTLKGDTEYYFNYEIWNAVNQAFNHVTEARFWLGFELQRIKESETSPNNIRV